MLNLLNDAGSAWSTGVLGTTGTLQNTQCRIDLPASDLAGSGNILQVTVAMTFSEAFTGLRHIYMYAAGGAGASGWQDRGLWSVP